MQFAYLFTMVNKNKNNKRKPGNKIYHINPFKEDNGGLQHPQCYTTITPSIARALSPLRGTAGATQGNPEHPPPVTVPLVSLLTGRTCMFRVPG